MSTSFRGLAVVTCALSLAACPGTMGGSTATDDPSGSSGDSVTDGPEASVTLHGVVHKGPFVLGTPVSVSPLTDMGAPTGQQFEAPTSNDLGEFTLPGVPSGPVAVQAVGFHFDEVRGGLSAAPLTLRALHRAGGDSPEVNLHVLGHLAEARARNLVAGGLTVEDALAQAEAEAVASLGVGKADFVLSAPAAQARVVGPDTDDNAYVFALSAVLMQAAHLADPDAADASLQALLNQLALDLADDGAIDDALKSQLVAAETAVQAAGIRAALSDYLDGLGLPNEPPEFERILDQDHDGLANRDDVCPFHADPDQADMDGDGKGDACDDCPQSGVDIDGDGYDDGCDNCPAVANPEPPQDVMPPLGPISDTDHDSLGDACDACPRSPQTGATPGESCCDPRDHGSCVSDPGSTIQWACKASVDGLRFDCVDAFDLCDDYSSCLGCDSVPCVGAGGIDTPCAGNGAQCDCTDQSCVAQWCTVGEAGCMYGNACLPWFKPGEALAGLDDLGICVIADGGPCAGKVGRECAG